MGVKSCSREYCDNIMCDTYINNIGYICSECRQEFKDYLETKNKTYLTEGEIRKELKQFMSTNKEDCRTNMMDIEDFFTKYG